jgi:hypothetical protein
MNGSYPQFVLLRAYLQGILKALPKRTSEKLETMTYLKRFVFFGITKGHWGRSPHAAPRSAHSLGIRPTFFEFHRSKTRTRIAVSLSPPPYTHGPRGCHGAAQDRGLTT